MTDTANIQPGTIIRFKRFTWRTRFSGMIVDTVEDGFLIGRKYRLSAGVVGCGQVTLAVTSFTVIEEV